MLLFVQWQIVLFHGCDFDYVFWSYCSVNHSESPPGAQNMRYKSSCLAFRAVNKKCVRRVIKEAAPQTPLGANQDWKCEMEKRSLNFSNWKTFGLKPPKVLKLHFHSSISHLTHVLISHIIHSRNGMRTFGLWRRCHSMARKQLFLWTNPNSNTRFMVLNSLHTVIWSLESTWIQISFFEKVTDFSALCLLDLLLVFHWILDFYWK